MKYKVGDRVKIREDLLGDKEYGDNTFTLEMKPWCGQVVTIECADEYGGGYQLEGCGEWYWTDEMIEGLASEASNDTVNHPSHYTDGKIEVIDFIRDKKLDFCRGNIIKYVVRAGKKGGKAKELEDLRKARQYCDFAIEALEAENGD
jgi:hypothetical protein